MAKTEATIKQQMEALKIELAEANSLKEIVYATIAKVAADYKRTLGEHMLPTPVDPEFGIILPNIEVERFELEYADYTKPF